MATGKGVSFPFPVCKYRMGMETTRKCHYEKCKQKIVLETGDFVVNKDYYYHFDCFVNSLMDKKRNQPTKEEAIQIAKQLKEESKDRVRDIIAKNHLYQWLQKQYDVVVIPSYFFTKMEAVFAGTYKGMARGIPAEDMFDIWTRKWNDLVKTYAWNVSKGNNMDGVSRLNYDLAIVLSKASSYYEWKEQQKTVKEEIQNISKERRYDINQLVVQNSKDDIVDYIVEDEEE
jgi:hypothetical protein